MLISFNMYINLSSDVLNQVLQMDVTEAVVGVARIDTTLGGVTRISMNNWNSSYDWKNFEPFILEHQFFLLELSRIEARHSGYSFVLTCYSWSLALCLETIHIKTDFNQMNDNLNEKSIQNALYFTGSSRAKCPYF